MKKITPLIVGVCFVLHTNAQTQQDQDSVYVRMAIEHGLDSADIPGFVHYQKHGHTHEDNTFRLGTDQYTAPLAISNPGFETGSFTNWTGYIGDNMTSSLGPLDNVVPGIFTGTVNPATGDGNARHSIMSSAAGNDSEGNFPIVPNGYGNYVARLGNSYGQYQGQYIEQSFVVTPAEALFQISFSVVIFDGGHPAPESPYFKYEILDSADNVLFFRQDLAVMSDPNYLPGNTATTYRYLPWHTDTLQLMPYMGQTLKIRLTSAGCIWGGHYCYAYVDVDPTDSYSIGVEEHTGSEAIVFPNPSADGIYFVTSGDDPNATVTVTDVTGRNIETNAVRNAAGCTLDLSHEAPGTYFLSISTKDGTANSVLIR